MVYVKFGLINWDTAPRQFIYDIDGFFDGYFEDHWIDDYWAPKVLQEIDKSKFIAPKVVDSPMLGPISHERISGGSKLLIMMNNIQNIVYEGDNLGDNCWPLFLELSKQKDFMISLSYFPIFKWVDGATVIDIDTGEKATNFDQFNTMHLRSPNMNNEYEFDAVKWPLKIDKSIFELEEIDF